LVLEVLYLALEVLYLALEIFRGGAHTARRDGFWAQAIQEELLERQANNAIMF
jgi:hypothetical protein